VVRGELDGKTFSEILALAKTKKATVVRVGFTSEPGIEEHAVAVVTFGGQSPNCTVRRNPQDLDQEIPCNQVGSYLRDGLKIPCGAFVRISVPGAAPGDGLEGLFDDLSVHGFMSAGSVGVIRDCDRDR
jgi:hypothetical protein